MIIEKIHRILIEDNESKMKSVYEFFSVFIVEEFFFNLEYLGR